MNALNLKQVQRKARITYAHLFTSARAAADFSGDKG